MLCLQLQRVRWAAHGSLEKLSGHVAFLQCLDLSACCSAATEPLLGPIAPRSASREPASLSTWQKRSYAKFTQTQKHQQELREGETAEHGCESTARLSCSAAAPPAGCEAGPSIQPYRLAAVIVHHSTARSGHYSTYRRLNMRAKAIEDMARHSTDQGSWVCVSDEDVRKADVRECLLVKPACCSMKRCINDFWMTFEHIQIPGLRNVSLWRILSTCCHSIPMHVHACPQSIVYCPGSSAAALRCSCTRVQALTNAIF